MIPRQLQTPFGDEPFDDVPLSRPPLARVLAQLRFDALGALASPTSTATSLFAAEIGQSYPYLEQGSEINMLITPGQMSPQMGTSAVWRFRSPDRATTVSLSNGSLALESTKYIGNTEFCSTLAELAGALKKVAYIPAYTRLGYRYSNRVTDPKVLQDLPSFVRPEILGISGLKLDSEVRLQHSLTQASFSMDENTGLLAQWGEMPPGGSYDPSLPGIDKASWVLDMDAFYQNTHVSSDPEKIEETARKLSLTAYRFFRWAVTDEFLVNFGGNA